MNQKHLQPEKINDLPDGFESLLQFSQNWGNIQTQKDRYLKRQSSTIEELREFHSTASPLLGKVFDYLDSFEYGDLPPKEARLFRIMLGLIEAAQAVEIFGTPSVPYTPYPHSCYELEDIL